MQNPFLILVVLLISGGLFMFTFESTQFNLEGFILVLLASFIGGIRWTLTQVLMQKAELGKCSVTVEPQLTKRSKIHQHSQCIEYLTATPNDTKGFWVLVFISDIKHNTEDFKYDCYCMKWKNRQGDRPKNSYGLQQSLGRWNVSKELPHGWQGPCFPSITLASSPSAGAGLVKHGFKIWYA